VEEGKKGGGGVGGERVGAFYGDFIRVLLIVESRKGGGGQLALPAAELELRGGRRRRAWVLLLFLVVVAAAAAAAAAAACRNLNEQSTAIRKAVDARALEGQRDFEDVFGGAGRSSELWGGEG